MLLQKKTTIDQKCISQILNIHWEKKQNMGSKLNEIAIQKYKFEENINLIKIYQKKSSIYQVVQTNQLFQIHYI